MATAEGRKETKDVEVEGEERQGASVLAHSGP